MTADTSRFLTELGQRPIESVCTKILPNPQHLSSRASARRRVGESRRHGAKRRNCAAGLWESLV